MSHSRENLKRKYEGEEESKVVPRKRGIVLDETTIKYINDNAREYAPLVLAGLNHLEKWEIPLTEKILHNAISARGEAFPFCIAIQILYASDILPTDTIIESLNNTLFKTQFTMLLLQMDNFTIPLTDSAVLAALYIDSDRADALVIALLTLHASDYFYDYFIKTISQFPHDPIEVADQLVADYQKQSQIIDAFLNDPEESQALPLPKVITRLVRTFFPHPGIMQLEDKEHSATYKQGPQH